MSKHTPGPWEFDAEPGHGAWVCNEDGIAIASVDVDRQLTDSDYIANGRLIAAGPDMLDALKAILAETVEGGRINSIARAAIDKATGQV